MCTSLLRSEEYYYPRLVEGFATLDGANIEVAPAEEDPSEIQELDLFVTGTDVDGTVYTQFDDAGHPIDVKDHRAVFLLKHRRGRKQPFAAAPAAPTVTYEALAKLSRITSCFPAAFAPVLVKQDSPGDDTVDGKLQLWGNLGKESCFLDGGVLDNKPFTHTIKAIFSRVANRRVERRLFYVEPDPEHFDKGTAASSPNVLQAVLASLIGIPGYESIADDLRLLADRNSKLVQYRRIVQTIEQEQAMGVTPPGVGAGAALNGAAQALYDRSRLVAISDRILQGFLRKDGHNDVVRTEDRERAARLAQAFDEAISNPHPLFDDFDVHFRQRRLIRTIYLIHRRLHPQSPINETIPREAYLRALATLNRQLKVYDVLQASMEQLVDESAFDWRTMDEAALWALVQDAFARLLDVSAPPAKQLLASCGHPTPDREWMPQKLLSQLNDDLHKLGRTLRDDIESKRFGITPGFKSLLRELDAFEAEIMALIPDPNDIVRVAYTRFSELDAILFPMESMACLTEKDIIQTVRISPKDAQKGFSRHGWSDKVSGDTLYHFGGFLKRSWRSNDILWGRLDGLCQLVESLVTAPRLAELARDADARRKIASRLTALDPAHLFPAAGRPTQDTLRRWLGDLFGNDDAARDAALAPKKVDEMVELLIEAAQLEVLKTDVKKVLADAIQDQTGWNAYRVSDNGNGHAKETHDGWTFVASSGPLDPYVAMTAAATLSTKALEESGDPDLATRPRNTPFGEFFRSTYQVGAETFRDAIPQPALLKMLAAVLLATRNSMLNVLGSQAASVRRNPFYLAFIAAPLNVLYYLSDWLNGARPRWMPLRWVLLVAALLWIAGGTYWEWNTMVSGLSTLGIFILAPLAVLALLFRIPRDERRRVVSRTESDEPPGGISVKDRKPPAAGAPSASPPGDTPNGRNDFEERRSA